MPETTDTAQVVKRIIQDCKFTLVEREDRRFWRRDFSDGTAFEITNLGGNDIPKTIDEPFKLWAYAFGKLVTPEGQEVESLRSFFPKKK